MKKNVDILQDISKIRDEKTCQILQKIFECLDRIDRSIGADLPNKSISTFSQPRRVIIEGIYPGFDEEFRIDKGDFRKILHYLKEDLIKYHHIAKQNLSLQFDRYIKSENKLRRRYNIRPSDIYLSDIERDVSKNFNKLIHFVTKPSDSVTRSSDYWETLAFSIADYVKLYRQKMVDIWKKIQEIEKYTNDNARFSLAKWALGVSISWIVLGQSANVVNNFQKIKFFVEILHGNGGNMSLSVKGDRVINKN